MRLSEAARIELRTNERLAASLIGKRIDDAEVSCETYNLRYRTVRCDGVPRQTTNDARRDRVNLVVSKGIVTNAWIA